jgi:antitoxin component YwqK of YwqJK toxin-antitoxin module
LPYTGIVKTFYKSNKKVYSATKYRNGIKDSVEVIYFKNGKIWRLNYYDNNGIKYQAQTYFKNGRDSAYFQFSRINNSEVLNGWFKTYYNDKHSSDYTWGRYVFGQLHDSLIEFYPLRYSREQKQLIQYKKYQINYNFGVLEGWSYGCWRNGNMAYKSFYKNGVFIEGYEFWGNGKPAGYMYNEKLK